MTEYWVAQKRHLCKFCNVWMGDNKTSIRHHEQGRGHKEKVEKFFHQKREAKFHGARDKADLDKQLREIEKAAQEQAQSDAALFGGRAPPIRPVAPPPPPRKLSPPTPLPRRDDGAGYRQSVEERGKEGQEAKEKEEETGRYTIGDVTYLEGKANEEKLVTGQPCEIWVEAEDKWVEEAVILSVKITAVPNTEIVFRRCRVQYTHAPQGTEPIEEDDVASDRLRLRESQAGAAPQIQAPAINETTGLGGWQTVSVRVVDEERERKEGIENMKREAKARQELEAKRRMRMMEDALEGEDAMSSYDPHNRGLYKGYDLKAAAETQAEVNLRGQEGPVAFKKRKIGADKGKLRRAREDRND